MAFYVEVSFPLPLLQTFTYRLPEDLIDRVRVGSKVLAPFGSRQLTGYVLEIKQLEEEPKFEVKEIIGLRGDGPGFSESFTGFIKELAWKNLVSPGQLLEQAEIEEEPEERKVEVVLTADGQVKLERGEIKGRKKEILELLQGRKLSPLYLRRRTGLKNLNAYLKDLKESGLIEVKERLVRKRRAAVKNRFEPPAQLPLPMGSAGSPEVDRIIKKISRKEPGEFLVFGSWAKRAVFFIQLLDGLTGQPGYIFILVPEIQKMRRWQKLLEHRAELVAFHSQLTRAERRAALERMNSGQARIILGTQALLLMPLEPVSLFVVDEEQDELYHQAEGVPFEAREASRLRAFQEKAVVIFTSSCPEVSSYFRFAKEGSLINVGQEDRKYDCQIISGEADKLLKSELQEELKKLTDRGQSVFVYVNKKGYAGYLECSRCHHVPKCRQCQIALYAGKRGKELYCRYCGEIYPWPERCPVCGQKMKIGRVKGSEFFREELTTLLPGQKVVTLEEGKEKINEEALIKAIAKKKAAIIIGTDYALPRLWPVQFPLVIVVNPEVGLRRPDFRAAERVFESISQAAELVANEKKARLIIITEEADDPTVRLAAFSDYLQFYERELEIRRLLNYPPFSPLVNLNLSGTNLRSSARLSRNFLEQVEKNFPSVEVIGPKVSRQAWHRERKEIRFYLRFKERGQIPEFIDFLRQFKLRHSSARININLWT
ncbi:MAG: replication restart helicase PriA [Candidatus Saccharicenans sp.]